MPFINVKTNVKISRENEVAIKTMLGEAIALIPGKSEKSLYGRKQNVVQRNRRTLCYG